MWHPLSYQGNRILAVLAKWFTNHLHHQRHLWFLAHQTCSSESLVTGPRNPHFKQTPSVILTTLKFENHVLTPPAWPLWVGMPGERMRAPCGASAKPEWRVHSHGCVAFQVQPGFSLRSCHITTWNWRGTASKSWELNASVSGHSLLWWTTLVSCGTFTVSKSRPGRALPGSPGEGWPNASKTTMFCLAVVTHGRKWEGYSFFRTKQSSMRPPSLAHV